jgi:hypothetical protein
VNSHALFYLFAAGMFFGLMGYSLHTGAVPAK